MFHFYNSDYYFEFYGNFQPNMKFKYLCIVGVVIQSNIVLHSTYIYSMNYSKYLYYFCISS